MLNDPKHKALLFHLKCRKWVEMIAQANDLRSAENANTKSRRISNGYGKGSSSAVVDDFAQDMELDEAPNGANSQGAKHDNIGDMQYDEILGQAMSYGQELQKDYRDEQEGEMQTALTRIFSLVAYDNPKESANGELLDKKGRSQVAEELNSAILGKQATLNCKYRLLTPLSFPWPLPRRGSDHDVETN